ncbi:hypothetical protein DRN69_01395 [Candidatus Pacearchaeota archaeon]|nr:MAG: hypothetical protein DRN69_01395 [Candidatus Pacearchaeota archaeon]
MDKQQIKKNKLDLEYHKLTQIFNSVLTITITGIFGFIGSFIFLEDKNKLAFGLTLSAVILILIYGVCNKIDKKLNQILKEIENI